MKQSFCAAEAFTLAVALSLSIGCGGRTEDDSPAPTASGGAAAGVTPPTGGARGFDAGCQSLPEDTSCYSRMTTTLEGESSSDVCDIPLGSSPPDANRLVVTVDCTPIALFSNYPPDVGVALGFYVDYNRTPAHLVFVDISCKMLQANGTHHIDIVVGCGAS